MPNNKKSKETKNNRESFYCPHCNAHHELQLPKPLGVVCLGKNWKERILQIRSNPKIEKDEAWVEIQCEKCSLTFRYNANTRTVST